LSVRAYRRALAVLLALLSLIPILVLAGREWALLTVLSKLLPSPSWRHRTDGERLAGNRI